MEYNFYAILEKENIYYNVNFPDLPGVLTFGNGIEEAIEMARDVLSGHLFLLEEDRDIIPKASEFQELEKHLGKNQQLQLITVEINE